MSESVRKRARHPIAGGALTPSADAITFDYATRGDTATSGVDFAPRTGTVTFQPGETSTTLQFPFISDSIQEANERFFVDLSNTPASIATGTAEIIILDDDAPTVSIIAGAPVVNLEDSADDAGRIPFVVFLDQPGLFPITVRIKSTPGTAGSADFVAIDQLITFAPGSVLFESEVVLLADRFAEANEQFTLALSDITNANPGTASMNAVIYDNDGLRISKSRLSATWRDLDGDLVTLTTTKPILKPELFSFRFGAPIGTAQEIAGQLLEALDLRSLGKAAEGVSLLFTSKLKDGLGDRHVNVGAIEAQGVRLGDVTVPGDLGKIDTGITLQPGQSASKLGVGLKTLTLRSLGVFGTTTQAAGGNLNSQIAGKIGAVKIAGDFADARLNATAGTGTLSIGGSLVGGANTGIYAGFKSITVKGDVLGTAPGSAVVISSETKQITIGGRVENAQIQSGVIDALKVSKGWVASSISASSIASIIIGGQVSGTAAIGDSYVFSASVIGRMTVAGEKVPLTKGPDNLLIGNTGDVRVRDLH